MAVRLRSWTSFSRRLQRGPWPEEVIARLRDALDAFTQEVREIDGAAGVVLFGSFARGDFGRRSDVDLLVLAHLTSDRSLDEVRRRAVRAAIDAETTFRLPMHLAVLVADAHAPGELGADLLQAIWSDGVVLFAETAILAALQPDGLSPWIVVRFSTAGLPPRLGVRLARRLHGRGGRPGLITPPAVELGRGAFLLPATQAPAVRDALDEAGALYDLIPVWRSV